jgi:acyl-CoA thioesterase-1
MFRTSFVWAAWAVVHLTACHNQEEPHPYGDDGLEGHVAEVRYLALGDSYTIGESVLESERWPNQLVDSLRARLGEDHDVLDASIVATTGWTTANLDAGMDAAQVDTAKWDLVSLLIGVNNQYQGLSVEAYGPEFSALLERAIALAGGNEGRVFVVSIPDYGYTPFGVNNQSTISAELTQFNDTCRARTMARGVAHFDITPISQEWPDTQGLVAADGLHPSGEQYGRWVASFADEVAGLVHP